MIRVPGNIIPFIGSLGPHTTIYYAVTYADAQALIAGGTVERGATYFITDRNVIIAGIATDAFSFEGFYLRGTEWNAIEYDFDNDHIQKETDKRGNSVGCTALYLTYGIIGTDPRSVFRWGDDLCLNNTVWNAVFNCVASTGQVFGNKVLEGDAVNVVTLTGNGGFQNNTISGTSGVDATGFTGTFSLNTIESGSTIDINGSSASISSNAFSQGSTIDFSAHTGTILNISCTAGEVTGSDTCTLTNLNVDSGTVVASNTANLTRMTAEGSTVTASGNANLSDGFCAGASIITATGGTASRCKIIGGSTFGLAGTASATSILVQAGSDADISGAAQANNAQLTQGNSLTISGTVDAIAVYMSTGAQIVATDNVIIEGLIARNVGVLNFSGNVICSPGEIENQSTVTLSGDGNYGNCFWKGGTFVGTGNVQANNCSFTECENVVFDDCGDIRNSQVYLERGAGTATLRFESGQTSQYINKDSSNKTETFTVVANVIDFDGSDVNHYTGIVLIDSTDTIDTISNLSNTTGAAPKRFTIKPTATNTVTLAAATATNIILPNGVATITLNGTNNDSVVLEHDGTNCYVVQTNNY